MSKANRSIAPPPDGDAATGSPDAAVVAGQFAIFLLTDVQRRVLDAEADALSSDAVKPAPPHLNAQLAHLAGLQATAVQDLGALTQVPVDGAPITREEVRELGLRIDRAREVSAAWDTANATRHASPAAPDAATNGAPPAPESMPLADLRAEIQGHRATLLNAFELRFRKDPAGRRTLQEIRAGRADAELVRDNVRLLALCNDARHRAWLAALPRGEARAAARLEVLAPAFAQKLATSAAPAVDLRALKARRDRAWTLVLRASERVLAAGRYLVRNDPARKSDYRGYTRPSKRKKKSDPSDPAPT